MILAARQLDHFLRSGVDLGRAFGIGHAHQRIGVADVQLPVKQRHAERRVEPGHEDRAELGAAVAIGIAQQRDAIGRRHAGTRAAHQIAHHPVDEAAPARGRVGLGHQHVAIGQAIHPARVIQTIGKARHGEAGGGLRLAPGRPAHRIGNVHGRDHLATRAGDLGPLPGHLRHVEPCLVRPTEPGEDTDADQHEKAKHDQDVFAHD